MMNAMPLPTGPMEITGGTLKTERPSPNAGEYGRAEGTSSFASTLKAVHEHHHTERDAHQSQASETSAERDNEIKARRSVRDEDKPCNGEESAQAMPAPLNRNENLEEEEIPAGPAAGKSEEGGVAKAENATNNETPITSQTGFQSQEALHKKAVTPGDAQGEEPAPKVNPEAATVAKATSESVSQTPVDLSQQTPTPASPPSADAANIAAGGAAAPDPMNQTGKSLQEKKKAETILPVLGDETGDEAPGTGNSLATEDGDAGENGRLAMDGGAKSLPSRADGRKGEAARDVPGQKTSVEPQVMRSEHSSNGETPPRDLESAGATGRETLTPMANDANGQTVDRQVPHDPMISITTAATASRTETVSPGAGAATTMAATEQFHQDNFNQLVERAIFAVRGEQSEARIALKPDHLGHVQMQVVTEHHLVSIKIMTESPAARDLIDTHAHQLKAELQHQGLTVEHIEVSVSNGQGDAYRGERQREFFFRQMASKGQATPEEDLRPLPSDMHQASTGRDRSRGIDYFA